MNLTCLVFYSSTEQKSSQSDDPSIKSTLKPTLELTPEFTPEPENQVRLQQILYVDKLFTSANSNSLILIKEATDLEGIIIIIIIILT